MNRYFLLFVLLLASLAVGIGIGMGSNYLSDFVIVDILMFLGLMGLAWDINRRVWRSFFRKDSEDR